MRSVGPDPAIMSTKGTGNCLAGSSSVPYMVPVGVTSESGISTIEVGAGGSFDVVPDCEAHASEVARASTVDSFIK